MQHVEEAAGRIEFRNEAPSGTSRMSAAVSPLIVR